MTFEKYIEALATEHTLVAHSEAEPHFACSMDNAASLMATKLLYPAIFVDGGDMVSAGEPGNELWLRDYTIAFVQHVTDAGNTGEVNEALQLAEQIMTDFVGRMVRDKRKGVKAVRRFDPLKLEAHRIELSEAGLFGWILIVSMNSPMIFLNCNDNFDS